MKKTIKYTQWKLFFMLAVMMSFTTLSLASEKASVLFAAHKYASSQAAAAIGFYSKGCLAGGKQLAETGPTWQAMRLSRNRNWGHPNMITFIEYISAKIAADTDWKGFYIGDISQPRGGPMLSGHASHQVGLDVDIWLYPPLDLNLSIVEREIFVPISVRSSDQRSLSRHWLKSHMQVLKIVAEYDAVDRIFITPPAKIYMCAAAGNDRLWLQKIRPYWGHHYHFHVRLKCPKNALLCRKQTPTVADLSHGGDGCDNILDWWITDALTPTKPTEQAKPYGARTYTMVDLPQQCSEVLKAK